MNFITRYLMLLIMISAVFAIHAEENNIGKKSGIAYLPLVGYTPETSLAMFLAVSAYNNPDPVNPDQKDDTAIAAIGYTLNNQVSLGLGFEKYLYGNSNSITAGLNLVNAPSVFFGIGNNVTESMKEEYEQISLDINLAFMSEITHNLYIGPQFQFYTDNISDKENILASGIIKGSEGITQIGTGAVIKLDTTDSFSYPLTGFLYTLNWKIFNDNAASDYSYNHVSLDLRNYFQICGKHVIGINAVHEIAGNNVPFQMLPKLGIMRGFLLDKYRDKHLSVLQAEYRFPVAGRFGGSIFAGAGSIAPEAFDFDFSDIKTAAGAGLRFNLDKEQHLNLRFDLAFNNENQTQFYMNLMEAF